MSEEQARGVIEAARGDRLEALIILAFALGMRPGELRALRWTHVVTYVDEDRKWRPVAEAGFDNERIAVQVWRSSSHSGDTKTPQSKRTLSLPQFVADALESQHKRYLEEQAAIDRRPEPDDLVFTREDGSAYTKDSLNYFFKKITQQAGLDSNWHPHEARHTFVSILSENEVKIQAIADAVGHKNTRVTESVYRHVIAPEIRGGADVMSRILDRSPEHG